MWAKNVGMFKSLDIYNIFFYFFFGCATLFHVVYIINANRKIGVKHPKRSS